jgi:5-methylcytosine-specific restriction enzyme subunit McrC
MRAINLKEWGNAEEVQVNRAEGQALNRLTEKLDIRWTGTNTVQIGPKAGYVGVASLSADLQLVVRPKVPVGSLLDLIALAYRTVRLPKTIGEAALARFDPVEWLAFLLVAEIEHLLEQGLRRGYVTVREEVPYVRGRISFEALHRTLSRPAHLTCEFTDYLADTPENRLLRGTLEILFAMRLHSEVKLRIATTLRAFSDVAIIRPSISMFGAVNLSRLNRYYEPALRLCQLFLEGSGVRADLGDVVVPAFFVPMEEVFERAVVNTLREEIGLSVHHGALFTDRFRHMAGNPALVIGFRPDILLGPRERPVLILDAKYLNAVGEHRGRPVFSNQNLYQMVTYCTTLGCPGILVYPRVSEDIDVTYEVSGTRVTLRTVDLAAPGLADLREFADEMAARLIETSFDRRLSVLDLKR